MITLISGKEDHQGDHVRLIETMIPIPYPPPPDPRPDLVREPQQEVSHLTTSGRSKIASWKPAGNPSHCTAAGCCEQVAAQQHAKPICRASDELPSCA